MRPGTTERYPAARGALLELHRTLIELERRGYERVHGRITPAALLDNLIHHPSFRWLEPFSAAIAASDRPVEASAADATHGAWLGSMRVLLTPDPTGGEFQRRYAERLQQSPELVLAHGVAMNALPR